MSLIRALLSSLDPYPNPPPHTLMKFVVLTGAGISADSGVSTFRDPEGLWAKYHWQDVATPEAFLRNPSKVHEFYNLRRASLPEVAPNSAHIALAEFESALAAQGHQFTLVTQNVDDLHDRAGSQNLLPMHGRLDRVQCIYCNHTQEWSGPLSTDTSCPHCQKKGGMRPWVVWFGETPRYMSEIEEEIESADHFAAIGTSGTVYPAAGLVTIANAKGIPTTEINLEPSENTSQFELKIYGPAAITVPQWTAQQLENLNQ